MNLSGKFGSASTIWYPASGYYYDTGGSLGYVGNYGDYWSASPNSYYAYALDFNSNSRVDPAFGSPRADAYSVRCLQEKTTLN